MINDLLEEIQNERELNYLVRSFMRITGDWQESEPFFFKAESLLVQWLFSYVYFCCDDVPYYRYAQVQDQTCLEQELPGCIGLLPLSDGIWKGCVADQNGTIVKLQKCYQTLEILLTEGESFGVRQKMTPLDCRMKAFRQRLIEDKKKRMLHNFSECWNLVGNYQSSIQACGGQLDLVIASIKKRLFSFENLQSQK